MPHSISSASLPFRSLPALGCLLCLLLLAGCATGHVPIREGTPQIQTGVVKDLRVFPQDMAVYAKNFGNDTPLLSDSEQALQDARFNRIFFGPWDMRKPSIKAKNFRKLFGSAKGYRGSAPWTRAQWNALVSNADIKRYPSVRTPAVTIRYTDLRELPTTEARYSKPTPDPERNPFDNFQYSLLPTGTPLYISHRTKDRQWYFVENPIAGGWVRAADVALVNETFINRYRNDRYAALIRDGVPLASQRGEPLGLANIGALFPVASVIGDDFMVMLPVRGANGYADITLAMLKDGDAALKPLPALPKLMAVIGNAMLAQPYGWGGMHGDRDCSSTTRDLFTPFGIWLPRNSAAQARAGRFELLENLPNRSKESAILSSGVPFMTLLWMRGHVGLYVGKYKGRAAFYHNIWGIRVQDGTAENNRHVIGRCVITSLEPGKELPNVDPDGTLITRIRGMSTLPGGI